MKYKESIPIAAAIGVYLLLQAVFDSWSLAFFVFATLPMALVGGVLAALLSGGALSIGALFGFFALFAIAVRNGIVLIDHFRYLEVEEGEPFGPELVLRGSRERLGPVLMTALATAVALLPFLFAGAMAGNEILRPLAAVIVGGLVTSTLLNTFVIPPLYLRFGARMEPATSDSPVSDRPGLEMA